MARIADMATPVCIDKYYGWDIIIYATVQGATKRLFSILTLYVNIYFIWIPN